MKKGMQKGKKPIKKRCSKKDAKRKKGERLCPWKYGDQKPTNWFIYMLQIYIILKMYSGKILYFCNLFYYDKDIN